MKSRIVSFLILSVFLSLLFTSAGNTLSSDLKIDLPSGTDSGYINVNGGKLYYEMAGEGEYIVLLHDGLIHREIWDEQFPFFAKNYRVVRYDRRGYGKSPVPHDQYSNIKDLDQLFIQLRIDKAVIFGMSSGGGLAIDFTLAHPEKVTALVLIGAVVSGYGYSAHMLNRGGHVNSLSRLLSDAKKTLQYFAWDDPYEIYVNNVKAKEKIIKLLQANMIDLNQEKHNFSLPPDRPAARFLSEIKVPALVLAGEYDIPDVHSHAGVIEFGISNAKREIIMNSGHLVPLEQPEAFNKSVLIFLDGLEFFNVLNSGGVKAAAEYFQTKRKAQPDILLFDEARMNSLGYNLLAENKIKDAIELFKLNVAAYPDSWNVYDSLGEAYLKDGQTDLAVKNYRKSLELNPGNTNARKILKNLEE